MAAFSLALVGFSLGAAGISSALLRGAGSTLSASLFLIDTTALGGDALMALTGTKVDNKNML